MKTCSKCKTERNTSEFYSSKRAKDGLDSWCKKCKVESTNNWKKKNPDKHRQNSANWRENNPEGHRRILLRNKYGLEQEDYDSMVEEQNGLCLICSEPPGAKGFHIDHDHSCCPGKGSCGECVRGLLCFLCNAGLGQFKDNISRMRSAIAYLERFLPPDAKTDNM